MFLFGTAAIVVPIRCKGCPVGAIPALGVCNEVTLNLGGPIEPVDHGRSTDQEMTKGNWNELQWVQIESSWGPSRYCARWSNEAAPVHVRITADHCDVCSNSVDDNSYATPHSRFQAVEVEV